MSASKLLPQHLQEKVRAMPETSYGATRVIVVLEDGTRIPDVYVAWAREIVKVAQELDVPFDASRVVDVELKPR